jgi:hypothetical protein
VNVVRALLLVALVLGACGRFGFDPTADGSDAGDDSGAGSGVGSGDGELGDGNSIPAGWTVFSPSPGTTNTLIAAMGFSADNMWIGGVGPVIYQFDGTSWVARSGPTTDINMLWAQSPTDVWEVGPTCDVNRWNGSTWTPNPPTGCSNNQFIAIDGVSVTDLWLAGSYGNIQHLVGTTWTSLPQGNNIDLWSVWAGSANDVYFVGTKGSIRHWTGSMADESISPNTTLSTVWGSSADDVWAVGGGGAIYHKANGGAWTQVESPTTSFLYGLWGRAANDIYAVGDNATVIHYDGTSWTGGSVPGIPTSTSLRWVNGVPGAGILAVGTEGTVLIHP